MFQRPYVWNLKEHWGPLWDDIRGVAERLQDASDDAAKKGKHVQFPPHFLGAIVLELMQTGTGSIETRSVIDGQQRLTTLQVFVSAAKITADAFGLVQQGRLLGKMLRNDPDLVSEPDLEFKVWPTNADRDTFRAVMRNEPLTSIPPAASAKLGTAMQYFKNVLESWGQQVNEIEREARFTALVTTLRLHLKLVAIDLDVEDNAQVIFETLNARGTPLQAADLIKNLLFQRADREGAPVTALYEKHWASFDRASWRKEIRQGRLMRPSLDVFLSHWLAMVKGSETLIQHLYPTLRDYVNSSGLPASEIIADLSQSGQTYLEMQRYPWRSVEGQFFYRQTLMDTTTTIPLLLFIFRLDPQIFTLSRRHKALKAIESYLIRRMLCRLTAKGYNRIFLDLLAEVKKQPDIYDEVIVAFLQQQRGESQSWPRDTEIRDSLLAMPLYTAISRSRVRLLLEAVEQSMGTDLSEHARPDSVLTIEHLLPQDWKAHWPLPADTDIEVGSFARDKIKHTIGNLTLVTDKLNPSLSNAAWAIKKNALRDHTVLRLNWRLLKRDPIVWDEQSITERTIELTETILQLWPSPEASEWNISRIAAAVQIGSEVAPSIPEPVDSSPDNESKTDADLVRMVLEKRAPSGVGRLLAEAFLGEVQSWSDVQSKPGESKRTEDNLTDYINIRRRKSPVGTFTYVWPKTDHVLLHFRLPREYAEGRANANARGVSEKSVYQVQMKLGSLEDVPEALDLARAAFENAGY
jgi:hypothetical protein